MNKIFKTINGKVTSELGKKKSSVAAVVASVLSVGAVGVAQADTVELQGLATGEDAVAIGENAVATAKYGVAEGKSAVATGSGFSREQFLKEKQKFDTALANVNAKQDVYNLNVNIFNANKDAADNLTREINDLTNKQKEIAPKLAEVERLRPTISGLQNDIAQDKTKLADAKATLDSIQQGGKNLFLNFTDVLNTLDWSKLNGQDSGRNNLATQLKNKVETSFADFAEKYNQQQYREIVDGYINRQAGYQGSLEYAVGLLDRNNSVFSNYQQGGKDVFNTIFYNTKLNADKATTLDNYKLLSDEEIGTLTSKASYAFAADNEWNKSRYSKLVDASGKAVNVGHSRLISNNSSSNYSEKEIYFATYNFDNLGDGSRSVIGKLINQNKLDTTAQERLNTLLLRDMSSQKLSTDNQLNLLTAPKAYVDLLDGNGRAASNLGDEFSRKFVKEQREEEARVNFGLKTTDGRVVDSNRKDVGILSILSRLKDATVNNNHLISSKDIAEFKKEVLAHKTMNNSIDWNHDKAAINLTDYKNKLNQATGYYEKTERVLDLYQDIINERKKTNADAKVIEQKTNQLITLKKELFDGMMDRNNFFATIELTYNKENADYYLNYAKPEFDAAIKRINNELRLYNDKDQIVVEATKRGTDAQKAYDDAANKLKADEAKLADANKKLDTLALSPEELAVNDKKREKEAALAKVNADKAKLKSDVDTAKAELDRAKDVLKKSDLRNLGENAIALGHNSFASGYGATAIGKDATATGNDTIALGTNAAATVDNAIAIGKNATSAADNAITIGTGSTTLGTTGITLGSNSNNKGFESIVIGNDNNVASNNITVVGNHITVGEGFDEGHVVLGDHSTAKQATAVDGIQIGDTNYKFAGTSPMTTVSIGSAGNERQIVNVAAGRVTDSSTDAINGSQLYAVIKALDDKPSKMAVSDGINAMDINSDLPLEIVGEDGIQTKAEGNRITVSYTDQTNVVGDKYITATKDGDTFNLKFDESVLADKTDIVGDQYISVTKEGDTFNLKFDDSALQDITDKVNNAGLTDEKGNTKKFGDNGAIKVVGDGKNIATEFDKDGKLAISLSKNVTVDSVKANNIVGDYIEAGTVDAETFQSGNVTLTAAGIEMAGNKITGLADGEVSATSTDAINGSQLFSLKDEFNTSLQAVEDRVMNEGITFVGNDGVGVTKKLTETLELIGGLGMKEEASSRNVRVDNEGGKLTVKVSERPNFKEVKAEERVTVGKVSIDAKNGINAGNTKVKGVAAGEVSATSTDAINGSQLHATNEKVAANTAAIQANAQGIAENRQMINNNTKRIDNLEQGLADTNKRVDKLDKKAKGYAANAMAAAALPQVYKEGKSMFSAATGTQGGVGAVAIGYSRASDNGKLIIKLNGTASSKGEVGVGAGVGIQW